MTSLIQYEHARTALAEATRIDQVLPILDEIEHVKLYAKQISDRALLADASEFQMKAERRLGTVIAAAKEIGHFKQGRQSGKSSEAEHFPRATLEEVGVDRKLSMRSQKIAAMPEPEFDAAVERTRERITSGAAKIIDDEPVNGARSIMSSRQEPDDSLDYFPTPPWATRALIETVFPQLGARGDCRRQSVWEPACGEGHMAEVLREYFAETTQTDIHDYGYGAEFDFLDALSTFDAGADWIITNPPFGDKTEGFVQRALGCARIGVAMFVRLQWLETIGRYEAIFRDHPPTVIAFFAERVNLCKGRWDPDGSTATAYIWLVWVKGRQPRAPFWIPPGQREALTRPDDEARFTAHPVIKRESLPPHDPETGELTDGAPRMGVVNEPAPSQTPATALPLSNAVKGAGHPSIDAFEIPELLKRTA